MKGRMEKKITAVLVIAFWLLIWQLAAVLMDNSILLASPLEVAKVFFSNLFKLSFWKTAVNSFLHIFEGFFLAFLLSIVLGIGAAKLWIVETLLSPLMQLVKAVPVASFVVLLLIWTGSARLSVWVTFLMVLPIIYMSVKEGIGQGNKKLLEMASVFGMPARERILYIYRPALMPFLYSGCKAALGMSWKAGVAAEVIGTPAFSIGERIYMSKIYLDTAGLFSWTIVVILLSFAFEKVFMYLLKKAGLAKIAPCGKKETIPNRGDIVVEELEKSYGENKVLENYSKTFLQGEIYAVMGESGCGKTTLFRILSGLSDYNKGRITKPDVVIGTVFQENRLCMEQTPLENVLMVARRGSKEEVEEALREILPAECLFLPCSSLSGGMQRRCAIARAVFCQSFCLILDEPFTGLDEETKKRTINFLLKYRGDRTVILSTHRREEAEQIGADILKWEQPGRA